MLLGKQFASLLLNGFISIKPEGEFGEIYSQINEVEPYIKHCLTSFADQIDLSDKKIIVDCANGALFRVAKEVFSRLNLNVVDIASNPDGLNINENCGAVHLDRSRRQGGEVKTPAAALPGVGAGANASCARVATGRATCDVASGVGVLLAEAITGGCGARCGGAQSRQGVRTSTRHTGAIHRHAGGDDQGKSAEDKLHRFDVGFYVGLFFAAPRGAETPRLKSRYCI